MCRNIRVLFNFEPTAAEDEIRAAAPRDSAVELAKAHERAVRRFG